MSRTDPAVGVRRVYDGPQSDDGYRALVDRMWPRGLTKDAVAVDEWCREIAPSTDLRRWYGHDPSRYEAFRDRYLSELQDDDHAAALAHLRTLSSEPLTLLTATRDVEISHAHVLAEYLTEWYLTERSTRRRAGGPRRAGPSALRG